MEGATKKGSVSYPTGEPALTNGQNVVLKGYFNGISGSSTKYVNVVLVSVESAGEVTSSITVADMEVEVGKTKTVQPTTLTPSNAVVTYSTTSTAISIDGNVIKGEAEGTATVTASIAAVAGSYTASSTTFTVTVKPASSTGGNTVVLTNDEIKTAFANVTTSGYADKTITSSSGEWTGNIYCKQGLEYVQIRNKTKAHFTSPTFSKNIEKIELTVNGGMNNNGQPNSNVQARNLYVIAANSDLSVFGDNNYNKDDADVKALWDALTKYGNGSIVASSTNVEQTVTIEFTTDTKNFMLVSHNGAAYITSITVFFK